MPQHRRRRGAQSLAVILAAILAVANSAGLVAALGSGDDDVVRAQPIAIPKDRATCAGKDSSEPWPTQGAEVIIPIGKECPRAADWLRWDDGHGAEAGDDAEALVDWILHPEPTDRAGPSWQRVLPGRSVARLRDAEAALNEYAGKVIFLPLFDRTRGSGDGSEVRVVGVLPFRLERAHLVNGDPACRAKPLETCLVGSLMGRPQSPTPTDDPTPKPTRSPKPTPTDDPTPKPTRSPKPTPTDKPTPSPSPTATPTATATPTVTATATATTTATATATATPTATPTAAASPTASPSGTPPPGPALGIRVPGAIAIPLERGEANRVEIPVDVTSNQPWSVCVEDVSTGADRGHMVRADSAVRLANPMRAGVVAEAVDPLDRPSCLHMLTAVDAATVLVVLEQQVGATDRPGSYQIQLVFRAIAGF